MAAGQGVAAPPAGPRWTAHPPESRGQSWLRSFTQKAVQPGNTETYFTKTSPSYKLLLRLDRWVWPTVLII